MAVTAADGAPLGQTTSGTFSPTLKEGIALALLTTAVELSAGDEVVVDIRGRQVGAQVVGLPFVPSHVR